MDYLTDDELSENSYISPFSRPKNNFGPQNPQHPQHPQSTHSNNQLPPFPQHYQFPPQQNSNPFNGGFTPNTQSPQQTHHSHLNQHHPRHHSPPLIDKTPRSNPIPQSQLTHTPSFHQNPPHHTPHHTPRHTPPQSPPQSQPHHNLHQTRSNPPSTALPTANLTLGTYQNVHDDVLDDVINEIELNNDIFSTPHSFSISPPQQHSNTANNPRNSFYPNINHDFQGSFTSYDNPYMCTTPRDGILRGIQESEAIIPISERTASQIALERENASFVTSWSCQFLSLKVIPDRINTDGLKQDDINVETSFLNFSQLSKQSILFFSTLLAVYLTLVTYTSYQHMGLLLSTNDSNADRVVITLLLFYIFFLVSIFFTPLILEIGFLPVLTSPLIYGLFFGLTLLQTSLNISIWLYLTSSVLGLSAGVLTLGFNQFTVILSRWVAEKHFIFDIKNRLNKRLLNAQKTTQTTQTTQTTTDPDFETQSSRQIDHLIRQLYHPSTNRINQRVLTSNQIQRLSASSTFALKKLQFLSFIVNLAPLLSSILSFIILSLSPQINPQFSNSIDSTPFYMVLLWMALISSILLIAMYFFISPKELFEETETPIVLYPESSYIDSYKQALLTKVEEERNKPSFPKLNRTLSPIIEEDEIETINFNPFLSQNSPYLSKSLTSSPHTSMAPTQLSLSPTPKSDAVRPNAQIVASAGHIDAVRITRDSLDRPILSFTGSGSGGGAMGKYNHAKGLGETFDHNIAKYPSNHDDIDNNNNDDNIDDEHNNNNNNNNQNEKLSDSFNNAKNDGKNDPNEDENANKPRYIYNPIRILYNSIYLLILLIKEPYLLLSMMSYLCSAMTTTFIFIFYPKKSLLSIIPLPQINFFIIIPSILTILIAVFASRRIRNHKDPIFSLILSSLLYSFIFLFFLIFPSETWATRYNSITQTNEPAGLLTIWTFIVIIGVFIGVAEGLLQAGSALNLNAILEDTTAVNHMAITQDEFIEDVLNNDGWGSGENIELELTEAEKEHRAREEYQNRINKVPKQDIAMFYGAISSLVMLFRSIGVILVLLMWFLSFFVQSLIVFGVIIFALLAQIVLYLGYYHDGNKLGELRIKRARDKEKLENESKKGDNNNHNNNHNTPNKSKPSSSLHTNHTILHEMTTLIPKINFLKIQHQYQSLTKDSIEKFKPFDFGSNQRNDPRQKNQKERFDKKSTNGNKSRQNGYIDSSEYSESTPGGNHVRKADVEANSRLEAL